MNSETFIEENLSLQNIIFSKTTCSFFVVVFFVLYKDPVFLKAAMSSLKVALCPLKVALSSFKVAQSHLKVAITSRSPFKAAIPDQIRNPYSFKKRIDYG